MIHWQGVCVHHSATKDSGTKSWDAIWEYHTERLGWDSIGYHFGLEAIGETPTTLTGRSTESQGAHCRAINKTHLGFCVVGDFDASEPPAIIVDRLVQFLAALCMAHNFGPEGIVYHNQYDPKTCPGRFFPSVELIRSSVARELEKRGL